VLVEKCTERKQVLEHYFAKNKGKITLAQEIKKVVVINKRNLPKLASQSMTTDLFHKAKLNKLRIKPAEEE